MKKMFILAVLAVFLPAGAACLAAQSWEPVSDGLKEVKANCVAIKEQKPIEIYAGTTRAVYKSNDFGRHWSKLMAVKGDNKSVNAVRIHKDTVFAATGNGLFKANGSRWANCLKKPCWAIEPHPKNEDIIYLAAEEGLFTSADAGRSWQRSPSLSGMPVYCLKISPKNTDMIYAGTSKGLYKSADAGRSWERIYVISQVEYDPGTDETAAFDEDEESSGRIQSIETDISGDFLYLGTSKGFLALDWQGKKTSGLKNEGLLGKDIKKLLILKDFPGYIFAATDKGAFVYSKDQDLWEPLGASLPDATNALSFDGKYLWAATDKGVFKIRCQAQDVSEIFLRQALRDPEDIKDSFKNEPTINEIQKAAIKYAEVDPEKIQSWRNGAKMKALMPKLSVGMDSSVSNTYEIYTSSNNNYSVLGPEDKSTKWGVSLSWDLGELVWNDAQTSIDVRSKLMVQLRDDILDEVTKYYFERRRLQINMLASPPQDERTRLEYELRLQELTANIDALTGGYLSKMISSE